MPFRNDLEAAHLKIHSLETELSETQDKLHAAHAEITLGRKPDKREKQWMTTSVIACIIMLSLGCCIGCNFRMPVVIEEEVVVVDPTRQPISFGVTQALRVGDIERVTFSVEETTLIRIDIYGSTDSQQCNGRIRLRSTASQNRSIGRGEGTIFQEIPRGHYSIGVPDVDACPSTPGAMDITLRAYEEIR